jgi:hypothetical protein
MKPALTPEEWEAGQPAWSGALIVPWLRAGEFSLECEDTFYSTDLDAEPRRRHALAALCLDEQPFGFTWEDVMTLREMAHQMVREGQTLGPGSLPDWINDLAARIEALLPPFGWRL